MRPVEKEGKSLKSKLQRYSFLFKMILTIYLLICFPMIIVQLLTLHSSYKELYTQNDIYCYTETKNLSSRVFSQISALRTIAIKIRNINSTKIKEYFNPNSPESLCSDVSKELSSYLVSIPGATHVGIYYADRQVFVNDSYYYRLESFCDTFAQGNDELYTQIYSLFTDSSQSRLRIISSFSAGNITSPNVIAAIPIKVNGYDAAVYMNLTYSSLNSFLTTSFSENSTFALFDGNGGMLFTNNQSDLNELQSPQFTAFLADETENKLQIESNGSIAYKWKEDRAPYTFVAIVEKSQFEKNSATFFNTMQVSLLANVLLTIILVAVTAYINYSPLKKLVSKIAFSGPVTASSELDRIESAITELDNRAFDQSLVIMDYVLNDLLYGMSVRQQQLKDLVPNFDCRSFCAVSVLCTRPTTEQSRHISDWVFNEIGCQIFITDIPNKEYSLFVCLSKLEIVPELLSQSISKAVHGVLGESCRIFVGTVVKSLDDIPLSYYASQPEIGDQSGLLYAHDYPAKEIQLLAHYVETASFSSVKEPLDMIFSYISRNKNNRTLCRYVCYEVLISYIAASKRTSYPLTNTEQKKLLAFANSEHLRNELEKSLKEMGNRVSLEITNKDVKLQNEIVEFVNKNYYQTDISLISVADYFGISIYTLSRVFKLHMGIGFKEYITAKRLELACRLLITTKDTIAVIAQNSGFESPTYFASIFKTHYGVTPSKFRGNPG